MKGNATVVLVGGGNIVAGKEIMLLTLARGLRKAGCGVKFITSRWGGDGDFVTRLEAEGFKYDRVRLGFISISMQWKPFIWTIDQLRYWPSLAIGYIRAIKAASPDAVVHTNWHHALLLIPFLDRSRDIFWCHEIVPAKSHYGFALRAISNSVASIVCVSHAVARSLERIGIRRDKVVVIHNGIAEILADRGDSSQGNGNLSVGIAGQIGAWKGHEDLVDAFALVAQRHPGLLLRIFGRVEGDFAMDLRGRIAKLGLTERVVWEGFVKDRTRIYAGMDVCVIPSRAPDPLPTAAIEASFCGLPVVATAAGGLPEIVEDGVTGILVPMGAPRELADAIERLVRDSELRRQMGASGRERMRHLFSERRFVADFTRQLFHEVPPNAIS